VTFILIYSFGVVWVSQLCFHCAAECFQFLEGTSNKATEM